MDPMSFVKKSITASETRPRERWETLLEKSQQVSRESGAEVSDSVKIIDEGRQERDDAILNSAFSPQSSTTETGASHEEEN
jgi:hypothetical protein